MPTQGELLQKKFKELYQKFAKTPFAIPAAIAVACLVFFLSVAYLGGACLSNLLAPLALLGMCWSFNIKSVKKLLVIGAVATLFFSAILGVYLVTTLQHAKVQDAVSEDRATLVGTLDPWYGGPDTLFTFNLTVTLKNDTQQLTNANVIIFKLGNSGGKEFNYSMNPLSSYSTFDNSTNITTRVYNYTYQTVILTPINQFLFRANISGQWMSAGEFNNIGSLFFLQGPVYKDSWAVAQPIVLSVLQYAYIYVFGPYVIILGMIWWTRRARRMRSQQIEKWEKEHAKADEEKPKESSKVPSLATAMGKEDDTFVCSECGADVPADATVCPKCGEKFD